MSLFEVKCPICKGTLWLDLSTGKVVDHKSADHVKADFKEFLKSREKGTAWDEKMKRVKEDEAKRKAEIELKFKDAKNEEPDISDDNPFHTALDWD